MATPHRELLTEVHQVLKAVRLMKHRLAPHTAAVPPGSLGVLVAVAAGREWHVKDLAAECALDPSTVSRAAAALVRAGLVERTADPADGRAGVLTATDAGRRALDEILACYDHRVAAALHDWTREEMRTFAALAQRFAGDLMSSIHPPTSLEAAR